MNKVYRKLAWTNIKNGRQFYVPYTLMGILIVAMFYTMVALTWNPGMDNMPGESNLRTIMSLGTVVIGIFAAIFLFYTNSFIMKRRKKELGVYNILGMEKKHIGKVMLVENLFQMAVSMGAGLLFGIIFNKLMLMVLYRMTGFETSIVFEVSKSGVIYSILLFAAIYFSTFLFNLLQVRLANPIELLHGSSVGEKEPKTKLLMTLVGIVCIGIGYYISITTKSPLMAINLFFIAVILVIAGTYCLFTAGSIALLKALRKNKKFYYKPNHFTAVAGMIYRMKQNAVGLSNICILSTMVLVMVSTTVSMYFGVEDEISYRYPYDVSITTSYTEAMTDATARNQAIFDQIKGSIAAQNRTILEENNYASFYLLGERAGNEFTVGDNEMVYTMENLAELTFMTRENYEKMSGNKVDEIKEGTVSLAGSDIAEMDQIKVLDTEFTVSEKQEYITESDAFMSDMLAGIYYVIVEDQETLQALFQKQKEILGEKASQYENTIYFNTDGSAKEKLDCVNALNEVLNDPTLKEGFTDVYMECRQSYVAEFYVLYGGLFFLGLFLGILFLMVTVLIIFYKQISEGYEDKERFQIMEKVGMSNAEVKRTISAQVRIVFILPIATAAIHVFAAFPMIRRILAILNLNNVTLFVYCLMGTILAFGLIYYVVFRLTSRSYYKIVGEQI